MRLPFYKYQGTGNDFIMLDYTSSLDDKLSVVAIQQLCDRKFGIGADGLIVINARKDMILKWFITMQMERNLFVETERAVLLLLLQG
jgi:diaminopimelate epimerase